MPPLPRLILASGSPRRREMLAGLGLDFAVRPVDLDESVRPGEDPLTYVGRLALEKAVARCAGGELVLAADTSVEIDDEIIGKPRDEAEARAMLTRLSGREHRVTTGVALCLGEPSAKNAPVSEVVSSRVWIAPMSQAEIAWYVATGEPMDKAGSYAIQGLGNLFVEKNDGNYTNVVGLPLPCVYRLFQKLGHSLLDFRRPPTPKSANRPAAETPSMGHRTPPPTALSRGPEDSFTDLAASYLSEYEGKIRYAIEGLSDEQIWWRPEGRTNSIGNLLLHLAGNLSLWIVKSIGGEPYERDRAGEFAASGNQSGAALLDRLSAVVASTAEVVRRLDPERLDRALDVQGYKTTVMNSAFHAVEHMSYHTGQIVWIAKQLLAADDSFEMYLRHEGE